MRLYGLLGSELPLTKCQSSVCHFQSMKSPVEPNSLFSKFFCYITWLDDLQTRPLRQMLSFLRNNGILRSTKLFLRYPRFRYIFSRISRFFYFNPPSVSHERQLLKSSNHHYVKELKTFQVHCNVFAQADQIFAVISGIVLFSIWPLDYWVLYSSDAERSFL